jgi:hypothetical protein
VLGDLGNAPGLRFNVWVSKDEEPQGLHQKHKGVEGLFQAEGAKAVFCSGTLKSARHRKTEGVRTV